MLPEISEDELFIALAWTEPNELLRIRTLAETCRARGLENMFDAPDLGCQIIEILMTAALRRSTATLH
jgi:hypothetical protein